VSAPRVCRSSISSFGRQKLREAGERRNLIVWAGSVGACWIPRAERLGALEGEEVGWAFRFDGTLDGGSLVCFSFVLALWPFIGAFLGSGASALAVWFGGAEFAPGLIDPAGWDSVVADFLGGMLVDGSVCRDGRGVLQWNQVSSPLWPPSSVPEV